MDTEAAIRLIKEAETWIGTPYHHKGMTKGVGADCGSFLYMLFTWAGLSMKPFPRDYPEDWCLHRGDERYIDFLQPYTREIHMAKPGDISVFRYGGAYSHGCLVTNRRSLIHAYGRTQDGEIREDSWKFFQYPGGKKRPVRFFEVLI